MKRVTAFAVILSALALVSCTPKSTTLKVISYNIRMGVADDGDNRWELRRPASIAMLREQNPEVFGVQEAYDFQVAYLLENLPEYKSVGVGREDGISMGEHMSIFYDTTRVNLLNWGTYWLSETPDVPSYGWDAACMRTATWTKMQLKDSGKEFFYVNTHLDHVGMEARKNGLALIVDSIAVMNPAKIPMILTGDFNMEPQNGNFGVLYDHMTSARESAEITTTMGSFNGWGKYGFSDGAPDLGGEKKRELVVIDYIFHSGFSKCLSYEVIYKEYEGVKYISDHYPVAAVLEF